MTIIKRRKCLGTGIIVSSAVGGEDRVAWGVLGPLWCEPELVEVTKFMLIIIIGWSLCYHSNMAKAARTEYIFIRIKI